MKKVNNLQISNKFLKLVLAGGMMFSLTACHSKTEIVDMYSSRELIQKDEVKSISLMDELTKMDELKYGDIDLVDAVDQLDNYMTIVEKTDNYKGDEVNKEFKSLDISIETVDSLISNLDKDVVLRKESEEKLSYINSYCRNWINENGVDISIQFMMAAIKCAIGDEFGVSVQDFDSIVIPGRYSNDLYSDFTILVGNDTYSISYDSGYPWEIIKTIYEAQYSKSNGDYNLIGEKKLFELLRHYINLGKNNVIRGIDEDKKGSLVEENDNDFINEYFDKETKSI